MSASTAGIAKMLLLIQALSGLCWVASVKCHLGHAPRVLFETSLGDNGTVTMSSSESCSKARTNIEQSLPSGAYIGGPFNVIPAPELVRDSCAINTIRDGTKHGYVNFGKIDQYKFISGPGQSGGYTWSFWIKISGCRGDCLDEHIKLINFKGSDEISPFSLEIMQGGIVCSARSCDKTVPVIDNLGQNLWFHIVCAFNFPNSTAKVYINGNEITSREEITYHPAVQSSDELLLGYDNPELSADLGYSNLVVTDGVLSGTEIKHLYSCGSMDWSLRLRSLNVSSSAEDPSDLTLQCTASAATGSTIAWRAYHSKCRGRDLHDGYAGSVRIENRNVSSCVQTSTLHLSNYHKRGYCGAVIECSVSSPNSPPPKPTEFRIPENILPCRKPPGKSPTLTDREPPGKSRKFDQIYTDVGNADRDDVCDGKRFYEEEDKVIAAFTQSAADAYRKVTAAVDGMEHAVQIPKIWTSRNETVVVVLAVYKSSGNASKTSFRGDSDTSVEFGSHIIEVEVATLNGTTFTDFHEAPVNLTFPLFGIPINKIPICSYSSGDDSYWYADGCVVASVVGDNVTCSCNHLTHFAVLLQLKEVKVEESDTLLLTLLTRIGLGLSITCLALTLLVYALCRLTSTRIVTHANLAFSIMASHLTFLFIDEDNQAGCTAVAILLHFFLLAAFTWMALEGVFLYVKSSPTLRWKIRLPIWLLTGWGCPAIVVTITAAVRFQDYTRPDRCWLSFDGGLVWAILAPFLVMITSNTIMLIRLIWIFLSLKTNRDKSEAKKMKAGLRLVLVLEPLLGLSWILNLFYVSPSTIFFAYASVILNSLQGVFMFLSQCLFDKKQREGLRRSIRRWTSELRAVTRRN